MSLETLNVLDFFELYFSKMIFVKDVALMEATWIF